MFTETPSSDFNPLAAIQDIPAQERQVVYVLAREGSPAIIASGSSLNDIPHDIRTRLDVCIHYATPSVAVA